MLNSETSQGNSWSPCTKKWNIHDFNNLSRPRNTKSVSRAACSRCALRPWQSKCLTGWLVRFNSWVTRLLFKAGTRKSYANLMHSLRSCKCGNNDSSRRLRTTLPHRSSRLRPRKMNSGCHTSSRTVASLLNDQLSHSLQAVLLPECSLATTWMLEA